MTLPGKGYFNAFLNLRSYVLWTSFLERRTNSVLINTVQSKNYRDHQIDIVMPSCSLWIDEHWMNSSCDETGRDTVNYSGFIIHIMDASESGIYIYHPNSILISRYTPVDFEMWHAWFYDYDRWYIYIWKFIFLSNKT